MSTYLGTYLAEIRREKNLSQRELADKSGICNSEISRIEAGQRTNPTPATLRALAGPLGIEYRDLMQLAGYMEEEHNNDRFYELVFKDADGHVVDIKHGVKDMFRKDEDWANIAYRVSRELSERDREILKDMAKSFLKRK